MSQHHTCKHCKRDFKSIHGLNGHKNSCEPFKKYLIQIEPKLIHLYVKEKYSRLELREIFEISISVVTSILKNNNIKIRTASEAEKTQRKKDKTIETWNKKYGVDNPFKSETIKGKIKETKLERYGNENFTNREKCVKIIQEKYGSEFINVFQVPMIKDKIKESNNLKFGCDAPMQSPEVIKKAKETKLERYGNETYNNVEQTKETCLKRYGVDNFRKSEEMKTLLWSEEAKEKSKNTKIKNGNNTDWTKYDESERDFYYFHVRKKSNENYIKYKNIINPNNFTRGTYYHLDHIVPIIVGFEQGLETDIISSVENLQIIPAKDNCVKNRFVCIEDVEKLLERYYENYENYEN